MMGPRQVEQGVLFYNFSLAAHVPADHLLRSIDALSSCRNYAASWRRFTARWDAVGRSELMIRMLIIGYCFNIRSERRLCEEVHLNLAYRWFCQLRLDGDVPDHFHVLEEPAWPLPRERPAAARLRDVLQRCIGEGLVGGEGFASMPA